jgi:hypothetical protein
VRRETHHIIGLAIAVIGALRDDMVTTDVAADVDALWHLHDAVCTYVEGITDFVLSQVV